MHDETSPSTPDGPARPLSAVLDEVVRTGKTLAAAEAARTRALAEAGHLALDVMAGQRATSRAAEMALREVASELAAAEGLSDRSVQRQIARAMTVVDDYPATLSAWEAGEISRTHAHVIADIGEALPPAARDEFDRLAVSLAPGLSPGRLRSRLSVAAERLHATTLTERHARGRETRCVRVVTGVDGMSDLVATLPTVLAVGIYDRLTQQARALVDHRAGSALGLADPTPDDRALVVPGACGASPSDGVAASDGTLDGGRRMLGAALAEGAATGLGTAIDGSAAPGATGSRVVDPVAATAAAPVSIMASDERTTAQLRADIFADLLLTAAPTPTPPAPTTDPEPSAPSAPGYRSWCPPSASSTPPPRTPTPPIWSDTAPSTRIPPAPSRSPPPPRGTA